MFLMCSSQAQESDSEEPKKISREDMDQEENTDDSD